MKPFVLPRLSDRQLGFRPKSSTSDVITYFDYCVTYGLELSHKVVSVYFDATRAFDNVPIRSLIECLLSRYELPGYLLKLYIIT